MKRCEGCELRSRFFSKFIIECPCRNCILKCMCSDYCMEFAKFILQHILGENINIKETFIQGKLKAIKTRLILPLREYFLLFVLTHKYQVTLFLFGKDDGEKIYDLNNREI